jgi:hypothetical protein
MPTARPAAQLSGPGSILSGVFAALDRAGIEYCVLHGYEGYPDTVPSDVDCMISADVRPEQVAEVLHEAGAVVVRCLSGHVILAGENADGSPCFVDLDLCADY